MKKVMKANVYANKTGMTQDEWLASRRNGIGGSDAAAIAGLNPYRSAYAVYMEKLGLAPEQEDNERMRQGRDLEEYVAQRFREHFEQSGIQKKTKNCNYILQHPKYPFMLANVDRLIIGENAGLECKTTSILNLKRFKGGEYPVEYYVQCMHYMAVTGADRWYLAVLILNQGFMTYTIERDEEEIANLIQLERAFWEENVGKRQEPLPDGSDKTGALIGELYPVSCEDESIDVSLYDDEIAEYMRLTAEIKDRERKQDEIKQRVQAFMKDAAVGNSGKYRVSWRSSETARLDGKSLKTEMPEIYARYVKPSTVRRFTINEIQ